MGCHLRIEFGTADSSDLGAATEPPNPRKNVWLPILVVLFLISYGLMTLLIVEQGRTIESQRALIRDLFKDSTELAAVRTKAQERARVAQSEIAGAQIPTSQNPSMQTPLPQAPTNQGPMTQAPMTQAPLTQAPAKQTPSAQAGTQQLQKQTATPKSQVQMPTKRGSDIADSSRSLVTI
jgi:hypothetical protein